MVPAVALTKNGVLPDDLTLVIASSSAEGIMRHWESTGMLITAEEPRPHI